MRHGDRVLFSVHTRYGVWARMKSRGGQELAHKGSRTLERQRASCSSARAVDTHEPAGPDDGPCDRGFLRRFLSIRPAH